MRWWPRALDFPWTLAVAALAVAATAAWLGPDGWPREAAGWLVADRARLGEGELWRAATGPLVHATTGHLVRDLALCLLVGIAYERPLRRVWPRVVVAGMVAPVLVTFAAQPGHAGYLGASGLSHAMMASAIAFELRSGAPGRGGWRRACVAAAAVGLSVKLGYEAWAGAAMFPMDLGPGVAQGTLAHLAGAGAGVLAVAPALTPARSRLGRWPRDPSPSR